jgi:hypothetical protein
LRADDISGALRAMRAIALTPDMADVLAAIVLQLPLPDADERISKRLADYEYRHLKRLERTRILVRFGPALGLMGTLIPLCCQHGRNRFCRRAASAARHRNGDIWIVTCLLRR